MAVILFILLSRLIGNYYMVNLMPNVFSRQSLFIARVKPHKVLKTERQVRNKISKATHTHSHSLIRCHIKATKAISV